MTGRVLRALRERVNFGPQIVRVVCDAGRSRKRSEEGPFRYLTNQTLGVEEEGKKGGKNFSSTCVGGRTRGVGK